MSFHIDTNTTFQRAQHGLLQSLTILPFVLFASGAFVPRWPLAPPGGLGQPDYSLLQEDPSQDWKRSPRPSTITLAT